MGTEFQVAFVDLHVQIEYVATRESVAAYLADAVGGAGVLPNVILESAGRVEGQPAQRTSTLGITVSTAVRQERRRRRKHHRALPTGERLGWRRGSRTRSSLRIGCMIQHVVLELNGESEALVTDLTAV